MDINLTIIEQLILSYMPTITAIVGIILAITKVIKDVKSIKIDNDNSINNTKEQIQEVLRENITLKKSLNELLTKIDHIERL